MSRARFNISRQRRNNNMTYASHWKDMEIKQMVPHDLTSENKLQRLTICSSYLTRLKMEPFFDRILTCDEKWVMYINIKKTHHY